MVAELSLFSLAMAQISQEDLQQAINDLEARLVGRPQMLKTSEEGVSHAVGALQEAQFVLKREFFQHVTNVEEKFTGDVEEARRQLVVFKGDLAEVKTLQSSIPHAPEASAHATHHLTRRKGFDGLATYGGGVQWKDWRFSTVHWLSQEHKPFEELLRKIERLNKGTGGAGRRVTTGSRRRIIDGRPAVVLRGALCPLVAEDKGRTEDDRP